MKKTILSLTFRDEVKVFYFLVFNQRVLKTFLTSIKNFFIRNLFYKTPCRARKNSTTEGIQNFLLL